MSDVSVIGLGVMGAALARALLGAGYSVTVWNRTADKAEPLVSAGATHSASVKGAVEASPAIVICIATHAQTLALLRPMASTLEGKTVIELSTGSADDAQALSELLVTNDAEWLIGIIHAYPAAVGESDTVLTLVGARTVWQRWEPVIKALGGSSSHVGTEARMLAPLMAALFTARQGFMFGMIYGGVLCKKAGIPLETYASQLPVSLGVLKSYYDSFVETVSTADFDNPPATLATHADAYDMMEKTFKDVGAANELPKLFSNLAHKGLDAGLGDKALTVLVEFLGAETDDGGTDD